MHLSFWGWKGLRNDPWLIDVLLQPHNRLSLRFVRDCETNYGFHHPKEIPKKITIKFCINFEREPHWIPVSSKSIQIYRVSHNYLDWAKYQNWHSSKSIWVMKLFFCQNDWGEFWQKTSFITHILFELCQFWYLTQSR